jgi:hypothetical protein
MGGQFAEPVDSTNVPSEAVLVERRSQFGARLKTVKR